MKPGRRFFLLASLFCLLTILDSCWLTPPHPLRIGANVWPGYEGLYLAKSLGYYNNHPIQLVNYPSATEVSRAFRNGNLEVAALTLDETLLLAETRPDIRIVLITDISHGGDAIVARPEIKTLAQLKGRRVGVEATALGAFVITRALEMVGLSPKDVNTISIGISEHEQAFKQGVVDAVVTFEPVRSKLLAIGANLVFDSRQMPGEIVDVLVVSASVLESQRKTLDVLVQGWFRALDYLATYPQDAARRVAPREGVEPNQFLASLQLLHLPTLPENQQSLSKTDPRLLKVITRLSKLMLEKKLLQQAVEVNSLLDDSLIKALI